jgi:hypothetical protein
MRGIGDRIIAGVIAASLSGCAFMRAATFTGDANSYKNDKAKVELALGTPSKGRSCADGPPTRGPYKSVVPAAIVTAAVAVALNLAESAIDSYVESKKKQFTRSYGAVVDADFYYDKKAGYNPSFSCIWLARDVDGRPAFRFYATLQSSSSDAALRIEPVYVQLLQAAALTDAASRAVDLQIEVKIDAVTSGEKGIASVNVMDKIIRLPAFKIGSEKRGDGEAGSAGLEASSWSPNIPRSELEERSCDAQSACLGITALSVGVGVTETGSGADAFGTLGKALDDNKKTLNDAIGQAVKDALTQQAPAKK